MEDSQGVAVHMNDRVVFAPLGQRPRMGTVEEPVLRYPKGEISVRLDGDPFTVQLSSATLIRIQGHERKEPKVQHFQCPVCGRTTAAMAGSTVMCPGPVTGGKHEKRKDPVTMRVLTQQEEEEMATATKAKGTKVRSTTGRPKSTKAPKAAEAAVKTTKVAKAAKAPAAAKSNGNGKNPYPEGKIRSFVYDLLLEGGTVAELGKKVAKAHPVKIRSTKIADPAAYIQQEGRGMVNTVVRELKKMGYDVTKDGRGDEATVKLNA